MEPTGILGSFRGPWLRGGDRAGSVALVGSLQFSNTREPTWQVHEKGV